MTAARTASAASRITISAAGEPSDAAWSAAGVSSRAATPHRTVTAPMTAASQAAILRTGTERQPRSCGLLMLLSSGHAGARQR